MRPSREENLKPGVVFQKVHREVGEAGDSSGSKPLALLVVYNRC